MYTPLNLLSQEGLGFEPYGILRITKCKICILKVKWRKFKIKLKKSLLLSIILSSQIQLIYLQFHLFLSLIFCLSSHVKAGRTDNTWRLCVSAFCLILKAPQSYVSSLFTFLKLQTENVIEKIIIKKKETTENVCEQRLAGWGGSSKSKDNIEFYFIRKR